MLAGTKALPRCSIKLLLSNHSSPLFCLLQLIFYIACSCVLTGVVVLVTLMVLYGGRRGSDARSGMYGESYALLDRRPLLGKRGSAIEEYSDDEEETAIDGNNARGTGAGRLHPPERSAGSLHDFAFEISTLSEIGVEGGATSWSEPEGIRAPFYFYSLVVPFCI